MKTIARGSFIHHLKKIKDSETKAAILKSIETVENADRLSDITSARRVLLNTREQLKNNYWRI